MLYAILTILFLAVFFAELLRELVRLWRSYHATSLFVIPQSHFCELGRWALTLGGVRFVERPYLAGIHMFFSPIKRLHARAGKRSTTAPLVVRSGTVLCSDSWACMALAADAVKPLPQEMMELMNLEVGPTVRTIAYSYLLAEPEQLNVLSSSPKIPWWQRFVWSQEPFQKQVIEKMAKGMVRSEEHVEACRERLRFALEFVEPLLAGDPCFALTQPVGGGALALATLLAPLTYPPGYPSHGYYPADRLAEQPDGLQREVLVWRATAAGEWCMRAYPRLREQVEAAAQACAASGK